MNGTVYKLMITTHPLITKWENQYWQQKGNRKIYKNKNFKKNKKGYSVTERDVREIKLRKLNNKIKTL